MLKSTLEKEELYNRILEKLQDAIGPHLKAIIVFGSSVYFGCGRDIDLIVIIENQSNINEIRRKILDCLHDLMKIIPMDILIFTLDEFIENLKPGTVLSGLALGYKILHDRENIEQYILKFLEELSKGKYVLHNRYGSWDLPHYARLLLSRKRKTI